jgi:hypothetical protein
MKTRLPFNQKISVIPILLFLFCLNLFSILEAVNRPEQMKTLADLLRGKWKGADQTQPENRFEMQGNWILDGHFVSLEVLTMKGDSVIFMEKFIFGWDSNKQAYTCFYFNSSGVTGKSLWTKKDNSLEMLKGQSKKEASGMEPSNPEFPVSNGSITLQKHGAQLVFNFADRKILFHIVGR